MYLRTNAILFIIYLLLLNITQLNAQTIDYDNPVNRYSFDLYRETKVENENLFLSPISTYYALLMAYEGSENRTKQEFEKVLHLKSSGTLKNDYLYHLACKLDSGSGFKVSNAIWLDKSLHVEGDYSRSVSNKYFSDFKQTEFANTAAAISDINQWVSEKTNKRITEIVSAENVNQDTKLLIANAVYFKGEWLDKFEKKQTYPAIFFANAENQYKIDFMKKREIIQYFENEEYQFISKPYKDSDLSFCIILPKKLFGIEKIEKKLNTDFLKGIFDNTYYTKTSLSIPKLKLEASYELSDALKNAGLKSAFINDADFSGITKEAPLMLNKVLHKTWIELDEEKTEAAAATVATIMVTGAKLASFKVFNADHPFVFFILDNSSRTILFMGRYVEPNQEVPFMEDKYRWAHNLELRENEKFAVGDIDKGILFVVDKKIITEAEFGKINPEDIESIKVLKDKEDFREYSSGDYDGAIIVTLKKKKKKNRTK